MKCLQSPVVFLTLTSHHQGYLDLTFNTQKNNSCKSAIKRFIYGHLLNTAYLDMGLFVSDLLIYNYFN